MPLMSRHHIDFVAFDRTGKRDRGPAINDPLAELLDHRPGVILVHVELLGDLQAGEVQPHQVQAGDPGSQRPVVAGEDRAGEVVEASPAGAALVALAVRLGVVPPVLAGQRPGTVVEFPVPRVQERRRIWQQIWPPAAPLSPDLDLDVLAARVDLSGGHLRNIAVSAAYLAAADGGVITMEHLERATRREYQQLGKLAAGEKDGAWS